MITLTVTKLPSILTCYQSSRGNFSPLIWEKIKKLIRPLSFFWCVKHSNAVFDEKFTTIGKNSGLFLS